MYRKNLIQKGLSRLINYAQKPSFSSDDVVIGKNVEFGKNVKFDCKRVRIGDGCSIMDNVRINATSFEIGDFGTIYHDCFFPGPGSISIGHNFWLGNNSIIDAQGGTTIGNNVGIGAHSQVWGHITFGDVMKGCRYDSSKKTEIGNDVWMVGHNLVSCGIIGDNAMTMLGSLVTKDIPPNSIFAGSPAKDISQRIRPQFQEKSLKQKSEYLLEKLQAFEDIFNIKVIGKVEIVDEYKQSSNPDKIVFNIANRTYKKKGTDLELKLIRFLLPRIKFVPCK